MGRKRMHTPEEIVAKLRQVQRLMNDLGVNLAGVDVILRMGDQMKALESENKALREELQRRRDLRLPAPRR